MPFKLLIFIFLTSLSFANKKATPKLPKETAPLAADTLDYYFDSEKQSLYLQEYNPYKGPQFFIDIGFKIELYRCLNLWNAHAFLYYAPVKVSYFFRDWGGIDFSFHEQAKEGGLYITLFDQLGYSSPLKINLGSKKIGPHHYQIYPIQYTPTSRSQFNITIGYGEYKDFEYEDLLYNAKYFYTGIVYHSSQYIKASSSLNLAMNKFYSQYTGIQLLINTKTKLSTHRKNTDDDFYEDYPGEFHSNKSESGYEYTVARFGIKVFSESRTSKIGKNAGIGDRWEFGTHSIFHESPSKSIFFKYQISLWVGF